MTASDLIALAKDSGLILKINPQGGLRIDGRGADQFVARYREHLAREKSVILAILRGENISTPSDDEIKRQARLEFALAFAAKVEQEMNSGVPEWLEWAFMCLFNDAMEGFVRWGVGDIWPQVQAAAEDSASEMRHRALARWAATHQERERHSYSAQWGKIDDSWRSRRDELSLETETWAWRAYLLEIALRNPEGDDLQQLDLWADLHPWAQWLSRNGKASGLVWADGRAA